ncbi:MAG: hypothetical protein HZB38_19555, partial [Planctomycetes bacterium]|nr:hypothetical protein [Planctomycetota bacterium]
MRLQCHAVLGRAAIHSILSALSVSSSSATIAQDFSQPAAAPALAPIPTLDLSNERDRQTIVDRELGQYLGHSTTVLLRDGKTLLCACPGVEILPDGTIVTTTYGHWTQGEQPYIVSIRLRLAELDAILKKRVKRYCRTVASHSGVGPSRRTSGSDDEFTSEKPVGLGG